MLNLLALNATTYSISKAKFSFQKVGLAFRTSLNSILTGGRKTIIKSCYCVTLAQNCNKEANKPFTLCTMSIGMLLDFYDRQLDTQYFTNFSRTPNRLPNPQFLFVQIVQRTRGGQLGLRLHSPNGQISEFGEIQIILG